MGEPGFEAFVAQRQAALLRFAVVCGSAALAQDMSFAPDVADASTWFTSDLFPKQ